MRTLALSPWVTVSMTALGEVFLLSQKHARLFRDETVFSILSAAETKISEDQIFDRCPNHTPSKVFYYIEKLLSLGVLIPSDFDSNNETTTIHNLWKALLPAETGTHFVSLADVLQECHSECSTKPAKVGICYDFSNPDFWLSCSSKIRDGWSIIPVEIGEDSFFCGPVLSASTPPCCHSFRDRIYASRPYYRYLSTFSALKTAAGREPRHLNPELFSRLSKTISTIWYAQSTKPQNACWASLDAENDYIALEGISSCRSCQDAQTPTEDLIKPTNSKFNFDRVLSNMRHPKIGLIQASSFLLQKTPAYVAMAHHSFPTRVRKSDSGWSQYGALAFGKGFTSESAMNSLVGESAERFSGIYRCGDDYVTASLNELGCEAIDPSTIMNYSTAQYALRRQLNQTVPAHMVIPDPLPPDRSIRWTVVRPMLGGDLRLVPTALCFFGSPNEIGASYFNVCSNGCAAGVSSDDAIVRGLYELIERDAAAIWWYNKLPKSPLELSFHAPELGNVRSWMKSIGCSMKVLNISTDIQIPAYVALAMHDADNSQPLAVGFGCNISKSVAIRQAILELLQIATLIRVNHSSDMASASRSQQITANDLPPIRDLSVEDDSQTFSLESSSVLDIITSRLNNCGLDAFFVSQTRPEIGIPVYRAIVPGLRHFWPRFAPGRLYDVPINQGFLRCALSESELSRVPLDL